MSKRSPRNKLTRIRREQQIRQLDLARRLEIHQSEVSAIECGEREPGVQLAIRVARALGKRVEDVF
jgi:putative transcriptional regulator